jgi:hypothetical protein
VDFFEKLLPSTGWYCTAELRPETWDERQGKFKKLCAHRWFDNINDLIIHALAIDRKGGKVYIAQSSYTERGTEWKGRRRDNVNLVKSFWFDIDCGEKKPYADQAEGCAAVKKFVDETGLPFPCVVRSGNGLYAYWFMTEAQAPAIWEGTANILKSVAHEYGFEVDADLTANPAVILRPPGSTNRKDPLNEKPVSILKDADEVSFDEFKTKLEAAAKKKKVNLAEFKGPRKKGLNDEFRASSEKTEFPSSSARQIAQHCGQVKMFVAHNHEPGRIPEPLWFDLIGLLWKTEEGSDIVHEWSKLNPAYSYEETEQRRVRKEADGGATTCAQFNKQNPNGCIGCDHKKLTTPLTLGEPNQISDEGKHVPKKFIRNAKGIFYHAEEGPVHVYPHDAYPVKVSFDDSLGYETVVIRHTTAFDGDKDFTLRTSSVMDAKTFLMGMCDNHLQVVGSAAMTCMVAYMANYIQHLRDQEKLSRLCCQMGWNAEINPGDPGFILGTSVFVPNEEPRQVGLARNIPEAVKGFTSTGEIPEWIEATHVLNEPDMAPHAFALMAGVFGAPLMRFTGYDGAMISLVGKTGLGKSLIQDWILSAYGQPKALRCLKDDTPKMILSRLGVYGSLPFVLDEVSNIDPMDLSNMVYRITQGRDRGRLTQDARERSMVNSWQTLVVCSSNHSLIEKLGQAKADAAAEISRVFEIYMQPSKTFCEDELGSIRATAAYNKFNENYGGVGQLYIQYIVDHQNEHADKIRTLTKLINDRTGAKAEERFWSAVAAAAIYGGLIASKLGIIKFEITPVLNWVADYIPTMRMSKAENIQSVTNVLASFLSEHNAEILVVRRDRNATLHFRELRGSITGRLELDTMKLYISKKEFKNYCAKSFVSMREVGMSLSSGSNPILLDQNRSKNLGQGVDYISTAREQCWELDMSHPDLGYTVVSLVKRMDEEKRLESVK